MAEIMGIVNLTPDSFWEPSRSTAGELAGDIRGMLSKGASIVDIGAVSTRPGAEDVDLETEWARLEPALKVIAEMPEKFRISIDTTRSEIIRRCIGIVGPVVVNDISSGEEDPGMLEYCSQNGLRYIAMHKRGNPRNMDSLVSYPDGIMSELNSYFSKFAERAAKVGIKDWILDPGLGFAKTNEQNWEILERLGELAVFNRPILIGASDKRFTGGDNERAEALAVAGGAAILRKHI